MTLSVNDATKLMNACFSKVQYTNDEINPCDMFYYNKSTWIVGGKLGPREALLCPKDIYEKGTWIPNLDDLIIWLEEREVNFNLSFDGMTYNLELYLEEKKFKSKGVVKEKCFYNGIMKILKQFNGSPSVKEYEIIEVELIDEER